MIGKLLNDSTALRIKESAKTTFLEKGYDGTTMQAIADGARVNKALVHYYFRSKDRLFLQIIKEELLRFQGTMTVLFKEPQRPEEGRAPAASLPDQRADPPSGSDRRSGIALVVPRRGHPVGFGTTRA